MAAAIVGHRGDVVGERILVKDENRILQVSQGIPAQVADARQGRARRQRQALEPSVVCGLLHLSRHDVPPTVGDVSSMTRWRVNEATLGRSVACPAADFPESVACPAADFPEYPLG